MRALVLLSCVCVVACTEPAREPRDGGQVVPDCDTEPEAALCDPASAENVMFTWADSMCDFFLGCCLEGDRARTLAGSLGEDVLGALLAREPGLLSDRAACQRGLAGALFAEHQLAYLSWDEGRQRFDREAARACLAHVALGAARCAPGLVLSTAAHRPDACRHLFVPLVDGEGTCTVDEDCVVAPDGGRSVCQSRSEKRADGGYFFSLTGACRPLPALGGACPLPAGACTAGAFCAADETCHARAAVGEPCLAAPCDEQGFCDTSSTVPTCAPRRPDFGPCSRDAECRSTSACQTSLGVCLERVDPDPLDVEFSFCLGDGGVALGRELIDGG